MSDIHQKLKDKYVNYHEVCFEQNIESAKKGKLHDDISISKISLEKSLKIIIDSLINNSDNDNPRMNIIRHSAIGLVYSVLFDKEFNRICIWISDNFITMDIIDFQQLCMNLLEVNRYVKKLINE
jgi:hypothetical protein